ncbi:MAG: endo-1,4-beta-xylanase [Myxococcota bacterium]
MRPTSYLSITLLACLGLFACSAGEGEGENPSDGKGGHKATGGTQNKGGTQNANGGSTASGGTASGGQNNSGGAANGGSNSNGGSTQQGGATSGGSSTMGGSSQGGASNGGSGAGGKSSSGGTTSAGGSSGGAKASGGSSNTGGSNAMGGAKATGGASSGGSASGGTSSGGASSGGTSSAGGSKATGGTSSGGSNSTGGTSSVKKFCGNITTTNSVDTGGMKFSKYWDQITPENAGKWGSVQSTASSAFNWSTLDAIYSYAQTNNIIFKQHTFVWGAQQPSGTPTLAQVENWIKTFCQRYPNTKLIDVVNEPPPHTTPNYTAALGAGESGTYGWITKAFKLARQYCPNAILILNDYNNIEYSDQENHFIDIVNQVKAAGAPIDAVGVQAHAVHSLSATALQNNINTMATRTGLPIYVTEYDVPQANDQTQLQIFQTQFPIFWNTASIKGVTVWGWINGKTWVANTGLVNGTTPRPAMTWLMQQLGRPVPPN